MNNQNLNIESKDFKRLILDFWKEDIFRKKTYNQLSKDFGLCGLDMPSSELEKCKNKEELNEKIGHILSLANIQRLLYIVDLKETLKSNNRKLTDAVLIRVAYKVYLRSFFISK